MMRERIKMIMEAENFSPAKFADALQIGRAVISHILNGRNNPSLDVITKIITVMPNINSQWLITGEGNMYQDGKGKKYITGENFALNDSSPDLFENDLFSQNGFSTDNGKEKLKYAKDMDFKSTSNSIQDAVNQPIIYKEKADRKVSKIIIYYSDNTFETFKPDK